MGLGGPNLVKGATGQSVDAETLGGATMHTEVSGVAHYAVDDDPACLAQLRALVSRLPRPLFRCPRPTHVGDRASGGAARRCTMSSQPITACRTTCTPCCAPCSMMGRSTSFSRIEQREMICGDGAIAGMVVGVIANQRGLIKGPPGREAAIWRDHLPGERRESRFLHRAV